MMSEKDRIIKAMIYYGVSYAGLADELGICEMSVRNKVSGKTPWSKLEKEKVESILNIKLEA
jgi:ribosome-binding protein aMBF1 (putative translation factor)